MKKKNFLTAVFLMTICVCTSVLSGCGDDEPDSPLLVTKIGLSDATLNLRIGEEKRLTATVLPTNAANPAVTWKSSNDGVARVTDGLVSANASGTCTITCSATDGSGVYAECAVTVENVEIGGHEYVEIGGLKWATKNLGATTVAGSYETCFGDYYAWGETEPRYMTMTRTGADAATFTWKNSYINGYNRDNYPTYTAVTLDAAHDAATAKWGGSWRTPKCWEFQALAEACSSSSSNGQTPVTLINTITEGGIYWLSATQTIESAYTGVAGLLFVSKSDISKRVFFPACGSMENMKLTNGGRRGRYWSSSLFTSDTESAYYLFFYSPSNDYPSSVNPSSDGGRCYGFTVRPVSD